MNNIQNTPQLTYATINQMVRKLHELARKDAGLASDLWQFMHEHHIEVPLNPAHDAEPLIPVSFTTKNTNEQFRRLQNAFDGIAAVEQIL